jgi:hypothetical protein
MLTLLAGAAMQRHCAYENLMVRGFPSHTDDITRARRLLSQKFGQDIEYKEFDEIEDRWCRAAEWLVAREAFDAAAHEIVTGLKAAGWNLDGATITRIVDRRTRAKTCH